MKGPRYKPSFWDHVLGVFALGGVLLVIWLFIEAIRP